MPSAFSAVQLYRPAVCLVTGLKLISVSGLKMPSSPSFLQSMVAGGLLSATQRSVAGSFSSSRYSICEVSILTVGGSRGKRGAKWAVKRGQLKSTFRVSDDN